MVNIQFDQNKFYSIIIDCSITWTSIETSSSELSWKIGSDHSMSVMKPREMSSDESTKKIGGDWQKSMTGGSLSEI